jgi:hypothetical protein
MDTGEKIDRLTKLSKEGRLKKEYLKEVFDFRIPLGEEFVNETREEKADRKRKQLKPSLTHALKRAKRREPKKS